jgi:hypothetical protein
MMELRGVGPSRAPSKTGVPWPVRAALASGLMLVTGGASIAQLGVVTKRILVLPTRQWNDTASTWQYVALPSAGQINALLGGLHFGMTPEQVGQRLAGHSSALHWDDLPNANEYSSDVRYFWVPMQAADSLTGPIQSCFGDSSSVNLLFFRQALFRISWRFVPDQKCHDASEAAEDLYAAFMSIAPSVLISTRYANGPAEVVDVTAPNAGPLIAVRWHGRVR